MIAEQSGSGKNVAAFCRERGLTTGQFFAWKKRLRDRAEDGFIEVQAQKAQAEPPKVNGGAIEVHLAGGLRICVEPGFDAELLRAVVAALEAR